MHATSSVVILELEAVNEGLWWGGQKTWVDGILLPVGGISLLTLKTPVLISPLAPSCSFYTLGV